MSQHQSPLLRLPRELRDEVYKYSLSEVGGYLYNPGSGRLRTAQGSPISFALRLTCKQAADETQDLALQGNTIRFTSFADASLNARTFDRLRLRCFFTIRSMLAWAAHCVTSDHLDIMHSKFPHNSGVQTLRAATPARRIYHLETTGIPDVRTMPEHVHSRAIQSLLDLIQKEPKFHVSTAKEYDATLRNGDVLPHTGGHDASRHFPTYSRDSQQRIIEALPRPWDIFGPDSLNEMAELMPEPQRHKDYYAAVDAKVDSQKRYCYSGTACAILFMKGLRAKHLLNLRKIVIDERHLSVSDMESHAHGLIPYCKENSKLCIDVKVDVWHVFLQDKWHGGRLSGCSVVESIGRWLSEASSLLAHGMPLGQCTILLGGPEPELLQPLWDAIKKAAAIHEAAQYFEELQCELESVFPTEFPTLVKQGFDGGLPLKFDAPLGEPWDLQEVILELEQLDLDTTEWNTMIDLSAIEQHTHILEATQKEYYTVG